MLDIKKLRTTEANIITIGSYPAIIQSILDFDYLSKKEKPSIKGIVASGRKFERYFFGQKEILIPVVQSVDDFSALLKEQINLFLNLSSGRRALDSTRSVLEVFPHLLGGEIFAEEVPEQHALTLFNLIDNKESYSSSERSESRSLTGNSSRQARTINNKKFLIGPSSIGLLIPGHLKLGAIGGVTPKQLVDARLFTKGSVCVLSSSGGMTNEIINTVVLSGKRISFALSFGGERFPILSPREAFLAAENDPETKSIVYFGELGGTDEAELADLLKSNKITKTVICYIAGTVAEMFETPPQFGHAKAFAQKHEETAKGKREMLRSAGANVANSYTEFLESINAIKETVAFEEKDYATILGQMTHRKHALITSSISSDKEGEPHLLGTNLLTFANENSFAAIAASLFLGKKIKSKELEEFVDFVLRIAVDHGPYVSGAVNTIVTARAGRDLVSSLATGLLTIGPRFGGAINQAASNWHSGVMQNENPSEFVEAFASKKQYISGIGHKKYRVDLPDPRVTELKKFADKLSKKRFTHFAIEVEKVTTAKKGNLILNVDGAIACLLLDILSEKEGMSDSELQQLVEIEFFNAFFVLSRSVGFIAHFLDQKRLDEGLFRLPEDLVTEADFNEES